MKKFNYMFVLALTMIAGIFYAFVKISDQSFANPFSQERTVMLVPVKGMTITSTNPVKLEPGADHADFAVRFEDSYFFQAKDGYRYSPETGILTATNLGGNVGNLYYTPGKNCKITIDSLENGSLEALWGEGSIPSDQEATLQIHPDEHYVLSKITVNGEEMPLPAGDTFVFKPQEDCVVSASFSGESVTFMAMSDHPDAIKILNDHTDFHYLDVVELNCEFDEEETRFLGWSKHASLADGGELVSEEPRLPYTLAENTVLYANFKDRSSGSIYFEANGGVIATNMDLEEQSPETDINLPVDTGNLTRSGYTLVGYNTEADGSGTFYSLGGMIRVPKDRMTLYAQWVEQTPADLFHYASGGSYIVISGFKNKADAAAISTLAIPSYIDGLPVTSVAPNSFKGCSASTVVVPVGVKVIDSGAFADCHNLSFLYLPETLEGIGEGAFSGAPVSRMRVLACQGRAFDYDYDSSMADRYMALKNTPGKRIILVAGSSGTFGLNSPMLIEAFPDYSVVNFSCSFLDGIMPLFDMLEENVHEGDIVIFAPEYFGTMYAYDQSSSLANWQYLESNYSILEDMDLQKNSQIFATFGDYLYRKHTYLPGKLENPDSTYVRSGMNRYGDLIVPRVNKGIFLPDIPQKNLVTDIGMARFNEACKTLTENGATCCFSFPPISDGHSYSKDQVNNDAAGFMSALKDGLDPNYCTVISRVGDYCFDANLFYDSLYHLIPEGAILRTEQLIADLRNWGGVQ